MPPSKKQRGWNCKYPEYTTASAWVRNDRKCLTSASNVDQDDPSYILPRLALYQHVPPTLRPLDVLEDMFQDSQIFAYNHLLSVRESVMAWAGKWGGVSSWPDTLEVLFYQELSATFAISPKSGLQLHVDGRLQLILVLKGLSDMLCRTASEFSICSICICCFLSQASCQIALQAAARG